MDLNDGVKKNRRNEIEKKNGHRKNRWVGELFISLEWALHKRRGKKGSSSVKMKKIKNSTCKISGIV
jgi:hypothetical protein